MFTDEPNIYFYPFQGDIMAIAHGDTYVRKTSYAHIEQADFANFVQGITPQMVSAAIVCQTLGSWSDFDSLVGDAIVLGG